MNFTQSISTCFSKYAKFSGRATRSEYWWFFLLRIIIIIVFQAFEGMSPNNPLLVIISLIMLALELPYWAVSARRLHDTNRTGWWQLISFIPLIGLIVMIVFCSQKGTEGDNEYGYSDSV